MAGPGKTRFHIPSLKEMDNEKPAEAQVILTYMFSTIRGQVMQWTGH